MSDMAATAPPAATTSTFKFAQTSQATACNPCAPAEAAPPAEAPAKNETSAAPSDAATGVAEEKAAVVSASESDSESSAATPRRCGKWSAEEEAFTARLIQNFDAGLLPSLENGTTLRAFLSKKLNCSTMRISKKFAGKKCLGKQIYVRKAAEGEDASAELAALAALEKAFLEGAYNRPPPRAKRAAGGGAKGARPPAKKRARRAGNDDGATRAGSSASSDDSLSDLSDDLGAGTSRGDDDGYFLPAAEAKAAEDVGHLMSAWSYALESFDLVAPVDPHDDLQMFDMPDLGAPGDDEAADADRKSVV